MRINPWRLFHGAFVPNWLMERRELTQGAKLAYARLCEYAGEKGCAFPSETTLANSLGVGVRQVKRYVAELIGSKLVETESQGMGKTSKYFFLDHPWMSLRGDIYVPPEVTHMSPIKDSVKEIHKKKPFRHVIPEGMALTEERFDVARKAGVNDPKLEWANFYSYYRASGALMLDWDERWRGWCRNAHSGNEMPRQAAPEPARRVSTPRETRYYDQARPDPSAGLQAIRDILKKEE